MVKSDRSAKAEFQKESKQQGSDRIPPQFVAKAEAAAKSLIPAGYGDPEHHDP